MASHRREQIVAAALCVAGGIVVLAGASRPWLVQHVVRAPFPPRTVRVDGSALSDAPGALAYVAVAGALAVAASRGWVRVAVGWLLVVVGLGVVAAVVAALSGTAGRVTAWPAVTAAGGALVAAGGWLVAARGRRWAAMSARYEAPAARRTVERDPQVAQWEAFDRGDDPTADPTPDRP
ncbi:MAG: Trp biosynthesis-associated membrane protein [Frankiaceae bacterium]